MDVHKITVAVCGDSFCSASVNDLQVTNTGTRAHFSQILEDKYGYQVLYFAHGGFGNTAILWQIREAVVRQANVVVYNKTWSSRIDLNLRDRFTVEAGLRNFSYYDAGFQSTHESGVGSELPSILSTTPNNIENSPFFSISREQKQAIDLYYKYIYNDTMRTEMDNWTFGYWHKTMIEQGILPVDFRQDNIGNIAYEFSLANPSYDTPFHTDRATQEQIAENIHRYIVDNLPK